MIHQLHAAGGDKSARGQRNEPSAIREKHADRFSLIAVMAHADGSPGTIWRRLRSCAAETDVVAGTTRRSFLTAAAEQRKKMGGGAAFHVITFLKQTRSSESARGCYQGIIAN